MKILLVEDEKYIAKAIEQILIKHKYSVDVAYDGEYALDCALTDIYDIIVLDIMLPIMDGLEVLREIRKNSVQTPVLLLTARDQIEDKVCGLDFGADDYLPKPYHPDELLARLRALGRRKPNLINDGVLVVGETSLNPHTLVLSRKAIKCTLAIKESQLLELLIHNKGIIVSKDTIIEKIWGYDSDAEDNNVETHISYIRKKLCLVEADMSIRTVRGAGYVLERNEV